MRFLAKIGLSLTALLLAGVAARAETITVATVNNDDMIIMQKLSSEWEKATGNKVNWVVLEENVLRQRVTTDIATKAGQFDIVTIGAYETPIWGKAGWLASLNDLGDDYDYKDVFEPLRNGLSVDGKLYALPFYAESSFTLYRKDLFEKAGLTMPEQPTWDQIAQFADKLTDKSKEQYGICLRGKPGWGENMGLITTIVNTFGGRWFDMEWKPQLTSDPWKKAIGFYVDLLKRDGPPGATSNGFNENQALFASGKCAIWVDATSAAGRLYNKATSKVGDVLAFAQPPVNVSPKGNGWFWAWSLAVPSSTKNLDTAKSFVKWATSKEYVKRVGETAGWVAAPPGTRQSTYDNPEYKKAAPFAGMVLKAILTADPTNATKEPVPYKGIQFVAIPEFQAIGTSVGQAIASILAGQQTEDAALGAAQDEVTQTMQQAGYIQ
ncbi:sugar ABC transporter substrate-binding protein [Labrys portucalensis]|uniref:Sugar ABC transporter substrate-binding protein n=1 Tax=Labrys neptuniae TaxID=376174 RepID=A0ABV6ZN69_9HYPH|nr:sugar ABC transporter substrate-binding protein [Labrys neptuniae]MDT3379776.1 sugar ABC transporter substrate-binding protein [Labrys neptuniae]